MTSKKRLLETFRDHLSTGLLTLQNSLEELGMMLLSVLLHLLYWSLLVLPRSATFGYTPRIQTLKDGSLSLLTSSVLYLSSPRNSDTEDVSHLSPSNWRNTMQHSSRKDTPASPHGSKTSDVSSEAARVQKARDKRYGDFHFGFTNLGRSWASIIGEHLRVYIPDLPAQLVELMVAEMKMHRMVRPFGVHIDDHVDLLNYVKFAATSAISRKDDYANTEGHTFLRQACDSELMDERPNRANK